MTEKFAKAYKLSEKAHAGQFRRDGRPYVIHLLRTHRYLSYITNDEDLLCASLIHDLIEDTPYTYDDVKDLFGERVANLVLEVTKNSNGKYSIETKEGLLLKLADTIDNLIDHGTQEYVAKKIEWLYTVI